MGKLYLFIIIGMIVSVGIAYADLSCQVESSSCSADYDEILHLSNTSNAHAELINESDYDSLLCCDDTGLQNVTISDSCSGTNYLDLSSATNAHVEKTSEANYNVDVCIYATDASFSCSYESSPCTGNQECLVTISNDTNAHIADCVTDPYDTYVCCELSYDIGGEIPEFNTFTLFLAMSIIFGLIIIIKKRDGSK